MADNMEANLCCNAIKDAFKKTKAGSGVIIHSDAGSQYTSNAYKSTLIELNHVKSYRNKSCVSCKNLTQK